jgi:hypothetical protein
VFKIVGCLFSVSVLFEFDYRLVFFFLTKMILCLSTFIKIKSWFFLDFFQILKQIIDNTNNKSKTKIKKLPNEDYLNFR